MSQTLYLDSSLRSSSETLICKSPLRSTVMGFFAALYLFLFSSEKLFLLIFSFFCLANWFSLCSRLDISGFKSSLG